LKIKRTVINLSRAKRKHGKLKRILENFKKLKIKTAIGKNINIIYENKTDVNNLNVF